MPRVLITDNTHPILAQSLAEAGFDVEIDTTLTYQTLLDCIDNYDAVVVRSKIIIDRPFLDQCHRLRCIARVGAGMETIDVDYAQRLGIVCHNSPEGNRDAVGEHAVALMLALCDNIARGDAEVRRGLWQREANRGIELQYRTVGIFGFGNMGSSTARRLSGFGCRIVSYDKYKQNYAPQGVEELSLHDFYQQADIVSLHVPLTDETRYLASKSFFDSFAHPIMLINTSRGAVVDTAALVEAMKQHRVQGAALDVIEYENMTADGLDLPNLPAPFQYLLQSPNTVITPHVAGWTVESKYKLAACLAEKIISTLK